MIKHYSVCILILLSLTLSSQETNIVPGNMIAMLHSEASAQSLCDDLKEINGVPTGIKLSSVLSSSMHIFLFEFDPAIPHQQMLDQFRLHSGVKIAQFNHTFTERITVPNDASYSLMWDMENDGTGTGAVADADIDATEAWDITTGGLTTQGDTIVVAVIDGGFKLNHADLNFWKNYDEIPNNGIDEDMNGYIDDFDGWHSTSNSDNLPVATHGTHVAGTVGARGNNSIGVTGVNWNVRVMPLSYGTGGGGFEANVVEAYSYARDMRRLYDQTGGTKGAFVVATNSSFGIDLAFPSSYPLWCAMYDSLGAVGILSAGATANANYNVDTQGDIPTACPSDWLITVTNTRNNDTKANAGYGLTTIDLGAPGTGITSTYYSGSTDTYSAISGTSMATPHVAGTVGLMLSVACSQFIIDYKNDPAGMALVLKDSLLNATDPIAALSTNTVTGGRLNLYKSVRAIQNYCLTTDAIEEMNSGAAGLLKVYPNPAGEMISISFYSDEPVIISMKNVLGQEIRSFRNNTSSAALQHMSMDVSDLDRGLYFVSLETGGRNKTVKVILR